LTLAAFAQAFLAALGLAGQPPDEVASLGPREKAALVVVSGLPAPRGVGGVIVRAWDRDAARPPDAIVFVDQEGGDVRAFPDLPPAPWPSAYATGGEAFAAGRETGSALRRAGVHVDLAPVLDTAGGPLGGRHFRDPELALAFARGLRAGGTPGCVKHFPGLGTADASTDHKVWVPAQITRLETEAFRRAIEDGVPCVMTSHAVYRRYGWQRAVLSPEAYRSLRKIGFDGVIVTDSLSIIRAGPWPVRWSRRAVLAGADLVLFTSPEHARRAIVALVPLARRGLLDEHVARVLELKRQAGIAVEP
jgi:beta-N-acetylhexosaminidase